MYNEILDAKEIEDNQRRGFAYEQIVRELLPWDLRPPISSRARSEQLDAIFQWAGSQFIVEAKAKRSRIDLGSSDWEDFELKIRRRQHCIGLFLSLFEIDQKIVERARNLNESGHTVILIAGQTWDELHKHNVIFQEYLRYLIFNARANHRPDETNFQRFLAWANDTDVFLERTVSALKKFSAPFVRRHRHSKHDAIYVKRKIDDIVADIAKELKPRSLITSTRRKVVHGQTIDTKRMVPKQICIIKDYSGSGKTTLGVQVASERDLFFGAGVAARQSNIDAHEETLNNAGPNYGLRELIHLDKPVVFFVDSLDEAGFISGKRDEVLSIIRSIERLNEAANAFGLIAFPICIIFTIRYEYWRDWESIFEGLSAYEAVRRFSYFSSEETAEALLKYSKTYDFSIVGTLNEESMRVLSHPFNMLIFAEANQYQGRIDAIDILSETVLSLYFDRKKEELLKRPALGFDSIRFMRLCGELAAKVVLRSSNSVSIGDLQELILNIDKSLSYHVNQIIQIILSEQVIVRDSESTDTYRFRHMRFIEYLLAYHLSMELHRTMSIEHLNTLIETYFNNDFVSIYNVHEFVRYISNREFIGLGPILNEYYGSAIKYTSNLLKLSRMKIGEGLSLPMDELAIVVRSLATGDEEICWASFFVLAAKNSAQPKEKILNAFAAIWSKAQNGRYKHERVKLIRKMADLGLVLEEKVLLSLLNSDNYTEWLSLFDEVDRIKVVPAFLDTWNEIDGQRALNEVTRRKTYGFTEVQRIFKFFVKNRCYPRGDFLVGEMDGGILHSGL